MNPAPRPDHAKFLGDGVLMIWLLDDGDDSEYTATNIALRLMDVQRHYLQLLAEADPRIDDAPMGIRCGIAQGEVCELRSTGGASEFIGHCINLAARLQAASGNLGWMAADIRATQHTLDQYLWQRVVVKKNSRNKLPDDKEVIVCRHEFGRLIEPDKQRYFR